MNDTTIKVVKSDGSKVEINLEKIHRMVEKACKGITGVSSGSNSANSFINLIPLLLNATSTTLSFTFTPNVVLIFVLV